MEIRKSTAEDVGRIMEIFAAAKAYMDAQGNQTQWGDGYPNEEILRADIDTGSSYVLLDRGRIIGTFSLVLGEETSYRIIRNGAWTHDRSYGTIHRLASDGTAKGIAGACFEFCAEEIDYIRIDTHGNNITMQNAIEKFGFKKCGIIYVRDGSERIAYDYCRGQLEE